MEEYSKKDLLNDLKNIKALPANILSASRITVPFVIPSIALSGNIPLLLGVGTAFMLTDFADGKIARALNGETKLGEKLDQIIDKISSAGLLLCLVPEIPKMALPLLLESNIALINADTLKIGGETKSIASGKLKMWPLSIMVISAYGTIATKGLPINKLLNSLTNLSFIATTLLEIENIIEYKIINEDTKRTKRKNEKEYIKIPKNDILDNIDNCDDIESLKQIINEENIKVQTKVKQKVLTN